MRQSRPRLCQGRPTRDSSLPARHASFDPACDHRRYLDWVLVSSVIHSLEEVLFLLFFLIGRVVNNEPSRVINLSVPPTFARSSSSQY